MAKKKTQEQKRADFEKRANEFVAEVDKLQAKYKVAFDVKERTPYYLTVVNLVETPKK